MAMETPSTNYGEICLITAVLTGDRTLELRVFGMEYLTVREENRLTDCLCRLVSRYRTPWRRYYYMGQ